MLPIGLAAQLACIWEATARKVGNVHPFARFAEVSYLDFVTSAAAIAPVLETAPARRVGETVLAAVQATRRLQGSNTNLGIILLLAPLAKVPAGQDLRTGVRAVLADLDVTDARHVYAAIRLANPGGLGRVPAQDVSAEPTQSLREVMALAAGRDLVARQYVNDFEEIFARGLPALQQGIGRTGSLEGAIIHTQLAFLAAEPDSLIVRKCGEAEGAEAQRRAADALAAGWPETAPGRTALAEFDAWLRAAGHRRNPGTSADLVTASLFAALRRGSIQVPLSIPFGMD
jgi:triphosphoribosyl-dephospho-CoA synthase